MNELALFAGAGGSLLAGFLLGWTTVCAVEILPYPISVLIQRQNDGVLPPFPIWDDVYTFNGKPWQPVVDVVSGGFPCQPFSTATHGIKTAIDLWPEMRRIIGEVQSPYVFAENVSEKAIKKASEDCQSDGYQTEWMCLSAKDVGADHLRRRYWLLAYSDVRRKLRSQINAEASQLPNLRASVWESYPDQSGVANGVADRLDRIKAIGNGQVPLVAATAWIELNTRMGLIK
jgi:DNA (cytosine-5)-methyltransferase 1